MLTRCILVTAAEFPLVAKKTRSKVTVTRMNANLEVIMAILIDEGI
jgi:hypothetical protein